MRRRGFELILHAPSQLRKLTRRPPPLSRPSPRMQALPRLLLLPPLLHTLAPTFWLSGPSSNSNALHGSSAHAVNRTHSVWDHHQSVKGRQERQAVDPLLRRDQVRKRKTQWTRNLRCSGMESCVKQLICTSMLCTTEWMAGQSSGCHK